MTHLGIDELLSARDGEADAQLDAHLAMCDECRNELERLRDLQGRLARLPIAKPERDLWPVVRQAAEVHRWRRPWLWAARSVAALAAVFTLAVGVRGGMEAWKEARMARETRALVAESQRLEKFVRDNSLNGRVVGGQTATTIAELEDQIGFVDAQLSQAQTSRVTSRDTLDLWQERVRLLDALANVQTTRVAYVGL